jgi:hypothetical protein
MALTGNAKVSFNFTQTKTGDGQSASNALTHALTLVFTDGVTAGSADRIWQDTRTLAASATEDLDFSGALTNLYGDTAVFADIRAILITADSANTNNVNVTRPASNGLLLFLAASDGLAVRPGGAAMWMCPDATGIAVAAGTADLLTFTNSAGSTSVTYTITVVGASA